jgi:hypothetical protein
MANEARLDFKLEDEDGRGNCVLRLPLPRFMDTSLVDLDVHPWYVSAVIKNKLFRIHWPEEVRADAGVAKRSSTSGELVVTVPKLFPRAVYMALVQREKAQEKAKSRAQRSEAAADGGSHAEGLCGAMLGGGVKPKGAGAKTRSGKQAVCSSGGGGSVMDMIMSAAAGAKSKGKGKKKNKALHTLPTVAPSKAVSVSGIVSGVGEPTSASGLLTAKATTRAASEALHAGAATSNTAVHDVVEGAPKNGPPLPTVDGAGGVLESKPHKAAEVSPRSIPASNIQEMD